MILVAESHVPGQRRLCLCRRRVVPRSVERVQVKLVHHVAVEGWTEDAEVCVPLRSSENQHVVLVHLADRCRDPLVQRLELAVVLLQLGIVRDRLVQQVVTQYRRLVVVVVGDALPDVDQFRLVAG